jgi:hypothetical protein
MGEIAAAEFLLQDTPPLCVANEVQQRSQRGTRGDRFELRDVPVQAPLVDTDGRDFVAPDEGLEARDVL